MNKYGICRFCKKQVRIPDNLNQPLLKCPFCTGSFEVCSSENNEQSQSAEFDHKIAALEDEASDDQKSFFKAEVHLSVIAFVRLQKAKKRFESNACWISIVVAGCATFYLLQFDFLIYTIAFFLHFTFCFGLIAFIIDSHYSKAADEILMKLFNELNISGSGNSRLYSGLLAAFAEVLMISEEEVISDPFFRDVLVRVDKYRPKGASGNM